MKKLWSKKLLFLIIFGGLLTAYFLWWNRGSSLPEVDDALLNLPITAPVPKEENLGYTLQGSGYQEMTNFLVNHFEIFLKNLREDTRLQEEEKDKLLCEFGICFFTLYEVRKDLHNLPSEKLNWENPEEYVQRNVVMSPRRLLQLYNSAELYEKFSSSQTVSELISAIKTQDFVIDEWYYTSGLFTWALKIPKYINYFPQALLMLTRHLTAMQKYDEAFEYWEVAYLLGEKLHKGSRLHTSFWLGFQGIALKTLYALDRYYHLPAAIKKRYYNFLIKHPIDLKAIIKWYLLTEYWLQRNMIMMLYQGDQRLGEQAPSLVWAEENSLNTKGRDRILSLLKIMAAVFVLEDPKILAALPSWIDSTYGRDVIGFFIKYRPWESEWGNRWDTIFEGVRETFEYRGWNTKWLSYLRKRHLLEDEIVLKSLTRNYSLYDSNRRAEKNWKYVVEAFREE